MMRDKLSSIMDLEFFSKRFNLRQELLSWGLHKITTEYGIEYIPVVIVEGGQVFIDIRKDIFTPVQSAFGRTAELLPALMLETENAYKFSSQEAEYIFTKDDVRALYERKLMF